MRARLFQLAVFLIIGLPVVFAVNFFLKAPDVSFVAAALVLLLLSNDLLPRGGKEGARTFVYLSAVDSTLLALIYRKFGTSTWVTFTAVFGVVMLNSLVSKRIKERTGEEDEKSSEGA